MGSDSIDITLTGGARLTRSYRYDASGNRTRACSGNTCTVYSYGGGAGPHAVSAVNGNSSAYAYNASGEMTKDNGRSLTWSAFGKALTITRGSTTLTLRYGPGNRRTRKTVTGPLSESVTYLGGAERLDINGSLSIRRTLAIADIAIIDTGGAQSQRLYPIADHLGSTIAIADSSGHRIQGLAYADFGQRYSAGWGSALTTGQALTVNTTLSDRGYTGQESLDAIGLDDYNARLYDPGLGRFLSVDPLIGHPGSTQGINPYSYVANNPLNRTDPTGESSCSGTSRTCVTMPMGNIKTKMVTPLGSRIPQKVSVNMTTGAVSGSLAGTDGHSIARSTDYNSMESFSPVHSGGQGQGTTNPNSTGNTNVNDGTSLGNTKGHNAAGGDSAPPRPLGATYFDPTSKKWLAQEPGIESVCISCWFIGGIGGDLKIVDTAATGLEAVGKEAVSGIEELFGGSVSGAAEEAAGQGGLVIGKMEDLAKPIGWRTGDYTLRLPKLPPGLGRWMQNERELQNAINFGRPIRDISPTKAGGFLDRERNILIRNGWKFCPETCLWNPGG